jgi:hypothetical protein
VWIQTEILLFRILLVEARASLKQRRGMRKRNLTMALLCMKKGKA